MKRIKKKEIIFKFKFLKNLKKRKKKELLKRNNLI